MNQGKIIVKSFIATVGKEGYHWSNVKISVIYMQLIHIV